MCPPHIWVAELGMINSWSQTVNPLHTNKIVSLDFKEPSSSPTASSSRAITVSSETSTSGTLLSPSGFIPPLSPPPWATWSGRLASCMPWPETICSVGALDVFVLIFVQIWRHVLWPLQVKSCLQQRRPPTAGTPGLRCWSPGFWSRWVETNRLPHLPFQMFVYLDLWSIYRMKMFLSLLQPVGIKVKRTLTGVYGDRWTGSEFLLSCSCREAQFGVKAEKLLVEREREH